jgi:two-component system phosphate regulon response regulator OmpR
MNATSSRQDRIVVVDDDARIRDLLRRYLTQEGFDVLLAEMPRPWPGCRPARPST